jgi:restriction system protein
MKSLAKVWMVRAGRHGEDEELSLTTGRSIIGWQNHGDLSKVRSIDDAMVEMRSQDKTGNEHRIANFARQFWAFRGLIQRNDIVVLPLKTRPGQLALGVVEGDYEYVDVNGTKRHTRRVRWVKPDVSRSTFKEDLLFSFGAFMTICRIQRNNADERVAQVLEGKPDPGYTPAEGGPTPEKSPPGVGEEELAQVDLAQAAQDEVVAYVRAHFQSHDLARLIGAILEAEGYVVKVSPPGPDGGADILAGRGPLGLDSPTLCVQVKATESAADVKIFRELVGTMNSFKADQGLLVCWGGFTQSAKNEARQQSFKVRLWDQSDIVSSIYRVYEKLPPEIQTELPLKRVWMLVREDVEEA